MPNYRVDFAYDGAGFHGYAVQPNQRTVQGQLEAALATVLGVADTTVAGRTDAGVHAGGQVVSFVTERPIETEQLERSLLSMLGPEIVVRSVREVPSSFDARFSATSRSYRYTVLNADHPDPLQRNVCWHVAFPLEMSVMNEAAAAFVGTHDFVSLCRRAQGRSTERTVHSAGWRRDDDLLIFEVVASSFCHQMVRSMVALCVDVGRGKLPASSVPGIIAGRDRNRASGAAPAHGLVLVAVGYPEDAA